MAGREKPLSTDGWRDRGGFTPIYDQLLREWGTVAGKHESPVGDRAASAAQVLAANGNQNPQATITAAAAENLGLALAATLLAKESNGRNVWGSDGVSTGGAYTKGGSVTRANYLAYRKLADAGAIGRQGCGPAQLTSRGYQDSADAIGAPVGLGCWDPVTNMRAGFRGLAALIRQYGVQGGAQRYNGSGPAAIAYGRDFIAKYAVWLSRLSGATPGGDDMTEEEHGMLVAVYQQLSGSTTLGQWPGWPSWGGGTGESLTLLDYLRRSNVETRQAWLDIQQLQDDVAALKAKWGT